MIILTLTTYFNLIKNKCLGRKDISEERRRCKPTDEEEELWQLHRKVTLLYSVFWAMSELLTWNEPTGGAAAVLNPTLEGWGIDPAICSEGGLFYENCRDVSTPWYVLICNCV